MIAAGWHEGVGYSRLLARDLFVAREDVDYTLGKRGYNTLLASFIHQRITYCRDQRLVYLAIHNHGGEGSVAFSSVDLESHARGYPALRDISAGMPVGALVLARGAIELDLWLPSGERTTLKEARIIGDRFVRQYADARWAGRSVDSIATDSSYDRQVLMFGEPGQRLMRAARVAVIGLGGIGSLVSEYLARLGVGELILIDPDRLEASNISRVVGARAKDLPRWRRKGAAKVKIAERIAREAQPGIRTSLIQDDFSRLDVASEVLSCDYIFLAADTMRARLVFNAIVNQYFIPGVQLGSKVTTNATNGRIEAAFSVVRSVRPGIGCLLCNQLIDATKLAEEWKTDRERAEQQYGTPVPNPSVITLNAVSAAHAVNDFLFYFLGLQSEARPAPFARFDHLTGRVKYEEPRRDPNCTECSTADNSRYGRGDARELPCAN